MRSKIKLFSITLLTALMLAISIQSCMKPPKTLNLDPAKEIITWNDSIKFESDPFKMKIKSVIYLKPDAIHEIDRWIPYIIKYPDMAFLFYFNSTDKDYILNYLKQVKFPIPVFLDTNSEYKGYLLVAFIINEKYEIVALTNPSLSNYETTLKNMKN